VKAKQCGGTTIGQVRCDQLEGHTGGHSRCVGSGHVLRWTDEDVRKEIAAYEARGGVL
jgi:hypothetical protein